MDLRKIASVTVASVVGGVLLSAIVYMLHLMLAPGLGGPAIDPAAQVEALAKLSRRAHITEERLGLAQIPWSRMVAAPEPVLTNMASQPWTRLWPGPAWVSAASLPNRLPERHDAAKPVPAFVAVAAVPWRTLEVTWYRHANIYLAHVPHWPAKRDVDHPAPARIDAAEAPWTRTVPNPTDAMLHSVDRQAVVPEADVPPIRPRRDRRNRMQGETEDRPWRRRGPVDVLRPIALASVPVLRSAASPDAAVVGPAAVPWTRDAAAPFRAHVGEASIPPHLKFLGKTRKGQGP